MATKENPKTPRRLQKTMEANENLSVDTSPKTPSRRRTYAGRKTPSKPETESRTPRRSTRKINKPFHDYNDIVQSFSSKKSICKPLIEENEVLESTEQESINEMKQKPKKYVGALKPIGIDSVEENDEQQSDLEKAKEDGVSAKLIDELELAPVEPEVEELPKAGVDTKPISLDTKEMNELESATEVGDTTKLIASDINEYDDLGLAPLEPEVEETEKCEDNELGLASLGPNAEETKENGGATKSISLDIKETDELELEKLTTVANIKIADQLEPEVEKVINEGEVEKPIAIEIKVIEELGLAPLEPAVKEVIMDGGVEKPISIEIKEIEEVGLAPLESAVKEVIMDGGVEKTVSIEIEEVELAPEVEDTPAVHDALIASEIKETDVAPELENNGKSDDYEEMESLIFCDDDVDFDCDDNEKDVNNDTFNASDCIILSPVVSQEDKPSETQTSKEPSPHFEVEATPRNSKPLNSDTELQDEHKSSTSKMPRQPTPYKVKKNNATVNVEDDIEDLTGTSPVKNIMLPVIEMDVDYEIIKPGIRKRSISMTFDRNRKTRENRVTFYSPANQTVVIEEFDANFNLKMKDSSHIAPVSGTPKSQPMANLDLALGNKWCANEMLRMPVIPLALASPSKKVLSKSMPNLRQVTRIPTKMKSTAMAKASALTLNKNSRVNFKVKNDRKKCFAGGVSRTEMKQPLQNLAMALSNELRTYGSIRMPVIPLAPPSPSKKILNKSVPHQSNQASTRIPSNRLEIPKAKSTNTTMTSTATKASSSTANSAPKMDMKPKTETRQRHIEMFKARTDRLATKPAEAKHEIIRGVRSNRRFDLQMQHRQNVDK